MREILKTADSEAINRKMQFFQWPIRIKLSERKIRIFQSISTHFATDCLATEKYCLFQNHCNLKEEK